MKPRAFLAIALFIVALAGVLLWLGRQPARPRFDSASCRGCNFLLITIDTLRRDRVGAFGGPGGLTATLDRLAAEGIRVNRAYASAPLTLPSHTSILTGVSPPVHGVRTNGLFRLGPSLPTLATLLKSGGYRTGAFVGAFVLDARFGLNRGFDVYDDRYGEKQSSDVTEGAERRAEDVIKPAATWILSPGSRSPSPWFAWVHLYDPHEPYRAPEPYASGREPYDGEVAYTDAMIGQLLDRLKATGQLDRTLVMTAADHGESLGEHDERTHGVFVYDVTMRVPWLIWAGSRIKPGGYDGLARLIDLAPTALDALGLPVPASIEGRSLIPVMNGRVAAPATAYLEAMDANLTRNWAPLTAVVSGSTKLIELPIPELYDLSRDPGETSNIVSRDPAAARTLSSLLRGETAQLEAKAAGGAEHPMLNAESRQRLQALGYVATSADPGQRVYSDADDPKNLIGISNELNAAVGEFSRGSKDAAMATVVRIIHDHPTFTTSYGIFASMQRDTGDLPGAIQTLEAVVRRGTVDPSVMTVLAGYLQEAGALDRAAGVLEAVIASHPDYAEAYNSLGVVYSRAGRHEEARAALRKVLDLDPTSATAYENLGVDELRAGQTDAAARDLEQAVSLDPKLAAAHNALGSVYTQRRDTERAFREWQTALSLNPQLYDALYNLGVTLWDSGRHDEARPYLERFVREAPPRYATDVAKLRALLR